MFNTFPVGCTSCLETGSPNQVWIADADGTGVHQVPNADGIEHVTWSPDELWLIGDGLARIHPDGTDRSQLGIGVGSAPVWSPDGSQIAYVGGAGSNTALSIADADGSNARSLLTDPNVASSNYFDVQWLPDATGLVFEVQTSTTSLIKTIARGDDSADAASVAGLAAYQQRPILLTIPTSLVAATSAALTDLHATSATVVGGTSAVSSSVQATLASDGVSVSRVSGATRYGTSAAVASLALAAGMTGVPWLADGANWPDALAAGPAAAAVKGILLLVDPNTLSASPETHAWLISHLPKTVVALGGPDVVSQADTAHALIGT